jgi:hypothetical protein
VNGTVMTRLRVLLAAAASLTLTLWPVFSYNAGYEARSCRSGVPVVGVDEVNGGEEVENLTVRRCGGNDRLRVDAVGASQTLNRARGMRSSELSGWGRNRLDDGARS